jgi:outer membrane protein OmpA-like peptidoglycan-associated protein
MAQGDHKPQLVEPGKLSVGVNVGTVYDTDFSRLDLNDFSRELSSDLSDDPSFSYLVSLNYQTTPSLSFGVNWGWGSIYGKNEIRGNYFNGDYTQCNFTTQLNIFSLTPKTTAYGSLGIGIIDYTANRSFIFDDKIFLEEEGESIKANISIGLQYQLNDKLLAMIDASYERVADDGFDSWNEGTGYHKFLYTSVGLRFTLGANENKVEDLQKMIEEFGSIIPTSQDYRNLEENYRAVEGIENLLDRVELRLSELESQKQAEENKDFETAKFLTEELKGRLFFAANSDAINVTAYPALTDFVKLLEKHPSWSAEIIGYADSDASEEYNLDLSKKRAISVVEYLKGLGVSSERLTFAFKGESEPFVENNSNDGKTLNRRVEIITKK